MKKGLQRFETLLNLLSTLMEAAAASPDPALSLYHSDARSVLFRLEGLSRIYKELHDSNKFDKLKDRFKELEDLLGQVDHYDSYAREFAALGSSSEVAEYFVQKKGEQLLKLNDLLIEKKWLRKKGRIAKIKEKLSSMDWMKEKDEIVKIASFYRNEINKINESFASTSLPFADMENDLHELRRQLRWLSIYPHALQGSIQLIDHGGDPIVNKYIVADVLNSPFNIMPDNSGNKYILLFEKNHFMALSWIISELGRLKDQGLSILAWKEAIAGAPLKEFLITPEDNGYDKAQYLLTEASRVCKTFFDEKNLEKMIAETGNEK